MAETVDDLSIEYTDNGQVTVKQLDKQILTKGAWATIVYQYQDWNNAQQCYGPVKYSIRRYQKRNGEYYAKSKFNISSADQAQKLIAILTQWLAED